MTAPTAPPSAPAEPVALRRVWWVGLAALAVAVLVNGLVRAAALATLDVDPGFAPLQTYMFVPLTLVGGGLGVVVFALLARFTRRPITLYRLIAGAALLLSLLPDLGLLGFMPGATAATVGALMVMHALTAAIVVGALTRFTRAR
ncbi:MAG: hypothetical protein IT317_01250 [Anaerolineales bacterium]|nr:hypothetical protein [Anaerolineales bacterium]